MSRFAAQGLTAHGKRITRLSSEVSGVTSVSVRGRILMRQPHYYHDIKGGGTGVPEWYDIRGRDLYLWPIPDQVYQMAISWDGGEDMYVVSFPEHWIKLHEKELKRAME